MKSNFLKLKDHLNQALRSFVSATRWSPFELVAKRLRPKNRSNWLDVPPPFVLAPFHLVGCFDRVTAGHSPPKNLGVDGVRGHEMARQVVHGQVSIGRWDKKLRCREWDTTFEPKG